MFLFRPWDELNHNCSMLNSRFLFLLDFHSIPMFHWLVQCEIHDAQWIKDEQQHHFEIRTNKEKQHQEDEEEKKKQVEEVLSGLVSSVFELFTTVSPPRYDCECILLERTNGNLSESEQIIIFSEFFHSFSLWKQIFVPFPPDIGWSLCYLKS